MKKVGVFFVFAFLLVGVLGMVHAELGETMRFNSNATESNNSWGVGFNGSYGVGSNGSYGVEASGNETHEQERDMIQNQTYKENAEGLSSKNETEVNYKYKGNNGEEYEVHVRTKVENGEKEQEMEFHGYNVSSRLEVHVENQGNESKLKVNLSNGEQKEIKILPDVASERAISIFQNRNVTVQLKEVGNGTTSSIVYEANGEKEVKLFGLFKTPARIQVTIDSNTGDVTNLAGPWWSFLASGFNSNVSVNESSNVSVK